LGCLGLVLSCAFCAEKRAKDISYLLSLFFTLFSFVQFR
jgi:hypothetical protein